MEDLYIADTEYFITAWYRHYYEDSKKICLSDSENAYSRREVEQLSGTLYAYLKKNKIGKESFVMIDMPRSCKIFIAMLAVVKAGAAFVVVERGLGKERTEFIKSDTKCKLVITEDIFEKIKKVEYIGGFEKVDPHDAAFAIYTSGTTGTPKGVIHEYGIYQMLLKSIRDPETGEIRQNERTRFLAIAPLYFVASVMIFVGAFVCSGGYTIIPDYSIIKNLKKLLEFMNANKVNQTFMSPSLLKLVGSKLNPEIEYVFTGSEPASNISINHGKLWNLYLMSEAPFILCQYRVTESKEEIPVGKPNDGLEVRLTEEGEIIVKNPYCRGYLNNKDNIEFEDGFYHTGDLAKIDAKGNYIIKGRKNDTIKINGNRVEPLEVELTATRVLELNECAVKGFTNQDGTFLCLYYVNTEELNKQEVAEKLKEYLPYYMIPTFFVKMDVLPRTSLGKLDRKALTEPDVTISRIEYIAPETDLQKKMCKEFLKVLRTDRIGIDDDLFELGLTSLDAIEVITALEIDELTTTDIYQTRTIRKLEERYIENKECFLTIDEKEAKGRENLYPLPATSAFLFYAQSMMPNTTGFNLASGWKFTKFANIEKLLQVLNEITSNNSMFKVRLITDTNGKVVQKYAPEEYKPVEIEYKTEEEVEELRKTFVRPYKLLEELPYRIRLIKTKKASYLFLDIHHVITDGEGMTLLGENIANLYFGKPAKHRFDYFAYCYDEIRTENSEEYKQSGEYVVKKYGNDEWIGRPERPGEEIYGVIEEYDSGITLKKLNMFLQGKHVDRGSLFLATCALVNAKYGEGNKIVISWMYGNRQPNGNQAGTKAIALKTGIVLDKKMKIDDLLLASENAHQDSITHCFSATLIDRMCKATSMCLDDLGDMESTGALAGTIVKQLHLERPFDSIPGVSQGYTNLNFTNKSGKLYFKLVTDNSIMDEAYRKEYLRDFKSVMKRIIEGDENVILEYVN